MKHLDIKDLILFENDSFFVLNKPPNVATLDERTQGAPIGLLRIAKATFPDAQACHRLDKETSGAIVFAKNPEAYRHLAMQFEARRVTKVYHAISAGRHELQGIRVFLPILPLKTGLVKIDKSEGKEAETIFNTLKIFKKHTLIECYPITGRMHQIRIHLSCLQAPIVMDFSYGGETIMLSDIKRKFNIKQSDEEQPLIQRVALHAYSINFEDLDGERREIIAPYPKDFRALVTQLEKST